MKKYIIMYEELEMTMKKIYMFKTFFAFVTIKARLHEILCHIQTRFELKSSNIFIKWRFKILTELIYKMNNNALKYKKRDRDFIKNIIEHSKKQNDENHLNFEFMRFLQEEIFREFLACTMIKSKIMLTKQSFNKTSKMSCCNTTKLMR